MGALERARAAYGTGAYDDATIEFLFPELKDSEDERIRRSLVKYFRQFNPEDMWDAKFSFNDILAYLEKQKEQKPAECIEDSVKFEEGFKVGRESGLRDGQKYVLSNLDSYGLCKPAEWSEEDENILEELYEYFRQLQLTSDREFSPSLSIDEILSWLKSLRPSWKPSEEQMEWLKSAVKLSTDKPHIHGIIISLYEQLKRL